ncbi:hypothetical protein P8452_44115 [Trifolium repens]|nr:hypothetical protein P8452_44115 [Trifolium repens]
MYIRRLILLAYRQIFGTIAIAPFAYFLERQTLWHCFLHLLHSQDITVTYTRIQTITALEVITPSQDGLSSW